jgi:predicted RNA-binding protein with RPS1 domain
MSKEAETKLTGPELYIRDEYGLLKSVTYSFNDDGSVNWRAMIGSEHLYPNKDWFESRNKPMPSSIDGLEDHQLLIKLSGIKELAKLRGITNVRYEVVETNAERSVVVCSIDFIPNYETGFVMATFSSMANATLDNTSGFGNKFLEAIAENRAFVRTVRNFLNIHIVGADEIDSSGKKDLQIRSSKETSDITPQGILKKRLEDSMAICSFDEFKDQLREWYSNGSYKNDTNIIKSWNDFADIPAKECRKILVLLKKS